MAAAAAANAKCSDCVCVCVCVCVCLFFADFPEGPKYDKTQRQLFFFVGNFWLSSTVTQSPPPMIMIKVVSTLVVVNTIGQQFDKVEEPTLVMITITRAEKLIKENSQMSYEAK